MLKLVLLYFVILLCSESQTINTEQNACTGEKCTTKVAASSNIKPRPYTYGGWFGYGKFNMDGAKLANTGVNLLIDFIGFDPDGKLKYKDSSKVKMLNDFKRVGGDAVTMLVCPNYDTGGWRDLAQNEDAQAKLVRQIEEHMPGYDGIVINYEPGHKVNTKQDIDVMKSLASAFGSLTDGDKQIRLSFAAGTQWWTQSDYNSMQDENPGLRIDIQLYDRVSEQGYSCEDPDAEKYAIKSDYAQNIDEYFDQYTKVNLKMKWHTVGTWPLVSDDQVAFSKHVYEEHGWKFFWVYALENIANEECGYDIATEVVRALDEVVFE